MRSSDPFSDLIRSIEENLQRDSDWVPPEGGDEPPGNGDGEENPNPWEGINPRRWLWVIIPLLLFLFFNRFISFFTDLIWYDSLGLTTVFRTRIFASLGLFVAGALVFWLFLAINVFLARRVEPYGLAGTPLSEIADAFGVRISSIVLVVGGIFAIFMGMGLASNWEELLVFLNQSGFGISDPVFGRDISFFLFTLPVWQTVRGWLMTTVIMTLIATAIVYGIGWRGRQIRTAVLVHLSVLGALLLLLIAWQYRLDALGLVYSQRGAVFGAGYTDVRAQLPVYNMLVVITGIAAILLVIIAFMRKAWRAIVVVLAIWLAVAVLAGNVYPGFVQRFKVSPNELNLERPYIDSNIEYTRLAFGIDKVEVRDYDASSELTVDALLSEAETVRNIRLWDYRPLLQTYNQIQALRQYYEFNDIDIDRYEIDGEIRQVMLAARELVPERLNENAQTWVNQRLVYTHGYGVAASPVAQVTRDGLPEFYLKDIPPQGLIEVTRPQIYFGERTNGYVITRTEEPEFDYPRGEGNVTTRFDADSGISMSFMNRLLFALRFADINILLNQDISADSQLLWRRNMAERIQEVAPFLQYDQDPYIVVDSNGELFWFLDAYTTSNRFPYSEPRGQINYIRNPVKVVTNAYDGSMTFYVVDEDEPIAAAYRNIFPELFQPFSAMPDDLKAHVRYPNGIFAVQADVYRTYHMTDSTEFYNKEDMWAWPEEIFDSQAVLMEPYYVLMSLPDNDDLDFIQILPFTPANRENMIAWLATQSDPDKYGEQIVYEFGKDSLFFGPKQVEARVDQDPVISAQLSLWNQQGSNVIRGNLLVIPLADSLIYVEPLYLQAASGKIPELTRVILATADRVVMRESLGLALVELFGPEVITEAGLEELMIDIAQAESTEGVLDTPVDLELATLEELIVQASAQYALAQELLREGNWAGYGDSMDSLQATLDQLVKVTGVELPDMEVAPEITPDPDAEPQSEPAGEAEPVTE